MFHFFGGQDEKSGNVLFFLKEMKVFLPKINRNHELRPKKCSQSEIILVIIIGYTDNKYPVLVKLIHFLNVTRVKKKCIMQVKYLNEK